ncbi:MAG: AAA family ATPase [Mobilitalea sp.]
MKKLILVTSPPASGKTYISKQLSKALSHVVYLDKDTLIPLSKQIFAVAGEEYNRSSEFFEKNIRDYEYITIVDLALEALTYDDIVLINAPFTEEIRDMEYIQNLKNKLVEKNASLVVVWVETSIEVCKQRMQDRNSDRDVWKLANWDEYIAGTNFNIPITLDNPNVIDDLLIFKNSSDKEFKDSMKQVVDILEETVGSR